MIRTRKIIFRRLRFGGEYATSNNEITKAIIQACESINIPIKSIKITDAVLDSRCILKVRCTKEDYIALVSDLAYDAIGIQVHSVKP